MIATIRENCHDDSPRRAQVRAVNLNGLDYLEVDGDRQLTVYFIAKLGSLGETLSSANFVIHGGRRVRDLKVIALEVCERSDPELDDCITLTLNCPGDLSTYTLCVVASEHGHPTDRPHPDFDPRYTCLDFTFQAADASSTDCASTSDCPQPERSAPQIDYLAKDYASFRQLMLDRLSLLLPGWTERHEPDLLVALVELLAYEGDRLSYYQDAAATEAYLHTARRRVSIRRHARLVDYFLHEGCNARAWVHVNTSEDTPAFALDDFFFVTSYSGSPEGGTPLTLDDLSTVPAGTYEVFEPLAEPPSPRLNRHSLLTPDKLCHRLLQGKDPVALLIRERLSRPVLGALEKWGGNGAPPAELVEAVLDDLERLAREQTLYDEKAFASHRQSGAPRRALQKPLHGPDMVKLNRRLLESALGQEAASAGPIRFYESHNEITLYTWGERGCCLPRGATSATLLDVCSSTPPDPTAHDPKASESAPAQGPQDPSYPTTHKPPAEDSGGYVQQTPPERCLHLQPGDFLLLEEVLSPTTGLAEDADLQHRHVVRLTRVEPSFDPVFSVPVLEVYWSPEDALPFPLCLSAVGPAPDCAWIEKISVARGNLVLVDHGLRYTDELDAVEVDAVQEPCDTCQPEEEIIPRRYRPTLARPGLTFSQPLTPGSPASARLDQDPHGALPRVRLQQVPVRPPRLDLPDPLERYRNPLTLTAFDPEDLLSPARMLARVQKSDKEIDPVARYLRDRLDDNSKKALADYNPADPPPDSLVRVLLAAFNSALDDSAFYNEPRFKDFTLDDPTRALLSARPLPLDLERLFNRWLLEQTCPEAIAPTRRFIHDWSPRPDLLASSGDERSFVVEMDDDRRALLRFGDGALGRQPEAATRFRAFYRVGNGTRGNVGADTITLFVTRQTRLGGITLRARNPLPATGGTDPEGLDEARMRAPYAIRRNRVRAVTAEDYAALASRDFASSLQGAAAELIWTGSWYEAQVTLDPIGRGDTPSQMLKAVRRHLEQYRRIGHDLQVAPARYVPLALTLRVCVKPDYRQAHVRAALLEAFGSRLLPGGRPAFFHPDSLKFGLGVAASRIAATAQSVPGVLWARVTQLERLGEGDRGDLENGFLPLNRTEIARLDGDPGFSENGSITLHMEGGR